MMPRFPEDDIPLASPKLNEARAGLRLQMRSLCTSGDIPPSWCERYRGLMGATNPPKPIRKWDFADARQSIRKWKPLIRALEEFSRAVQDGTDRQEDERELSGLIKSVTFMIESCKKGKA